MEGKLIIFSAPSGSGKSTLIQHLIDNNYPLTFSVSATSRAPRGEEKDGVHYHFLTTDQFKAAIANDEFIEYEEVYAGCFYGTLKSEVNRRLDEGKIVVLDVDVKGGVNVKRMYGNRALSIFIQPPSVEALRERLMARNTDSLEMIDKRVKKAAEEMTFAAQFDKIVVNDNLATAKTTIEQIVSDFIARK